VEDGLWSERNARHHDEHGRTIYESVKWTIDIVTDLSIEGQARGASTPKKRASWQPPKEGILKLNVDASFQISTGEGASGLVVRDHVGILKRGQAIMYENVSTVLIMEALAIRDGVKLAADSGLSRIEVETDANEVVKLWRGRNEGRSEIAPILREIDELSNNFEYFQLNFIGREANEAAHICA
jgi:ribonuclease HI